MGPNTCQGRLTLESGVPVSTTSQSSKSTIYFTPYNGTRIALHNGTNWIINSFTETSTNLAGLTGGLNYDVFGYNNSGTLALELLAWSTSTARATGLTTQDGIYVKSGDATRRYLGTFQASAATTTEDTFVKRFVWNNYNRVPRPMKIAETGDSWTYNTASFRKANNSTASRLEVCAGLSENTPYYRGMLVQGTASATNIIGSVGIGASSITANVNAAANFPGYVASIQRQQSWSSYHFATGGIGYLYLQLLEYGNVASGITYYGDDGGDDRIQSGMMGWVED